MFTVIFLDEHSSEQIRDYSFLFQPLIEQGILGFCNWNAGGNDLNSSAPDLYQLIRGKRNWRAVVLSTDSLYEDYSAANPQNPFDFSEKDSDPLPHESSVPLIRLTHILGGYPGNPSNDFESGYEYFDDEKGETVRIARSELSEEQLDELMERFGSLKPVFLEKTVSTEILHLYDYLDEKYRFTEARPDEILLIGTRLKSDKNEKARLLASCQPYLESSSSNFWKTNRYPNACRFLFSEISRPDCSQYQQEIIQFWLSVLTIASNELSPGVLQAYRLYRLGIHLDTDVLTHFIAEYDSRLKAAEHFIQEKINALPEFSTKSNEHLLVPEIIPIVMEKSDENEDFEQSSSDESNENEKTSSQNQGFGAYDVGVSLKKQNALDGIQNPRRAIDRAARTVKFKSHAFSDETYELDQFQINDLQEKIDALELKLFQERPRNKFKENRDTLIQTIKTSDEELAKIPKSMSLDIELKAGAACLIIALIGNISYLIDSFELENGVFTYAVVLTLILLIVTAMGGILALRMNKPKMEEKIDRVIDPVRQAKAALNNSNAQFEDYFSDVCTYMKGRAMIAGTNLCEEATSSEKKRLMLHKTAIHTACQRNINWKDSFGLSLDSVVIDSKSTGEFDIETDTLTNSLYFFKLCSPVHKIALNTSGEQLQAFYPFIQSLRIEREEIFDIIR